MKKIRVLVVDDSALIRELLTRMLSRDPAIEVVGCAPDPHVAREKIKALNPDVLTLDVEMPRMDGLTFLEKLMRLHPMPVVMVSSLTAQSAEVTLRALELGAVDFIQKPKIDIAASFEVYAEDIAEKVKLAARTKVECLVSTPASALAVAPKHNADAILEKSRRPAKSRATVQTLIAIGASTGGTEAVKAILVAMPADSPAIVVAQHIPEAFSGTFARRMDQYAQMRVCEAKDGQEILTGHVYIAPGSHHLLVERSGSARFLCRLSDGPPVNRHRPSVDVLFRSMAQTVGERGIGILLTGMGDDGAQGLKEMRDAGSYTIAQDEQTSVVWGMPGAAVKLDAVCDVLPLERIARKALAESTRR